jgi:MFS family permease
VTTDAGRLPASIPSRAFVPLLLAGTGLAGAYGTSFLLADHLRELGHQASMAGAIISAGTIATVVCALFAGRVAARIGLMTTITVAALVLAAAMTCFGLIGTHVAFAYAGGLLLGIGWSVFYVLSPVQVIQRLRPPDRIKYLTLLSGAQMLGLGLAPLIGRALQRPFGTLDGVYFAFAAICGVAAALLLVSRRAFGQQHNLADMPVVGLTRELAGQVMSARTALPIAMIGLAACVFAGLSTFQTLYADSRGFSPELFFAVFTATTVCLRFSLAALIGRVSPNRLVLVLFVATLAAVLLFRAEHHSVVLYALATVIFATGYGLTYSTLNSMVVNMAGDVRLSVPVASQVFTLAYFIGLFGFPYVGGMIIQSSGVNAALTVMAGIIVLNICLLIPLTRDNRLAAAGRAQPRPPLGQDAR